ncbi:C-type lectin galactose-binding isoform-like isoform X2 [Thamnophis elegans]|uniref:C-type lectin galactose-binding isoform-like isoform X2 n=1 Tax=Thamnophis elegans TaxID=35005 RepID=UPI001377481F|nr:C-type lectin galactose-binding isoform-like isoform X2 [Thamnophis elegans]
MSVFSLDLGPAKEPLGFIKFPQWRFCRKLKPGCHLASIHFLADSLDLADYLTDYLSPRGPVWIGMWGPNKNSKWVWTDGSKNDFLPLLKDLPNQIKNKEFCLEITEHTGYLKWNYQICTTTQAFLCQCRY